MGLEQQLFRAFGQEAELPASVQACLERSYGQVRERAQTAERGRPRQTARLRRLLVITAALAFALLATAFAAYYSSARYKLTNGGESFSYSYNGLSFTPALVLRFDTPAEGNAYFIRADWLPIPPTASTTAREALSNDPRLLKRSGMSDEELDGWFRDYSCVLQDPHFPYQIQILSPSYLHDTDYLLGYAGGKAEILEETQDEVWYTLKVTVDYTSSSVKRAFDRANFVFRFHREEGYLLAVYGTLDFEDLDRITENLRVKKSERALSLGSGCSPYSILDPGRG